MVKFNMVSKYVKIYICAIIIFVSFGIAFATLEVMPDFTFKEINTQQNVKTINHTIQNNTTAVDNAHSIATNIMNQNIKTINHTIQNNTTAVDNAHSIATNIMNQNIKTINHTIQNNTTAVDNAHSIATNIMNQNIKTINHTIQNNTTAVDNAHSIATNIMIQKSENIALGSGNAPPINGSYNTSSNIPIVFSAVNGERLTIGIGAHILLTNTTYSEAQLQNYLGVNVPIDVTYMTFHLHKLVTYVGPAPANTTSQQQFSNDTSDIPESQDSYPR